MSKEKIVIGIDLGTTYSCVGYWKNNKVEIIPNDQGNRTTPSYISFDKNERLIGESAKNISIMNPTNTIFDVKRLIGRKFFDPYLQKDLKYFPFKIININDSPYIEAEYMGEVKKFSPEELSAMVLKKMKDIAESYIGKKIDGAVITVPAYFNDSQRNSTKDAGIIAGLNILRIINEPTAAALAYGLDKITNDIEKNILIFDFGGGTHDITILTQFEGFFEVKATCGDTHLGGEDIDIILTEYCINEFKKKFKIDLSDNCKAKKRIKNACERAKRTLSNTTSTKIEIDAITEGYDLDIKLTRAKYEDLCLDIFKKTIVPIEDALKIAKMGKKDIHEIILVGGSTRIPKIRELLKEYFYGKELNLSVNPDEAVAYGAAIQAAILGGNTHKELDDIVIIDATPLTLGIETQGHIMTPMIKRGTSIPTKKTNTFTTYCDNQSAATIVVYEGERKFTKDCTKLGEFTLNGIPPAPRGTAIIEVTYDIDANSILNITAIEKNSGKEMSITIKNEINRHNKEEIDKMINDAKIYEEEDKKNFEKIEAKNQLESYLYQSKNQIKNSNINEKNNIENYIEENIKWLDQNQNQEKYIYENKLNEIKDFLKNKIENNRDVPSFDNNFPKNAENINENEKKIKIEDVD